MLTDLIYFACVLTREEVVKNDLEGGGSLEE